MYHVLNKSLFKKFSKYNDGLQHKFKFTQTECNDIIDLINTWSLDIINNSVFIDKNIVNKLNTEYFYNKYIQPVYDYFKKYINFLIFNNLTYNHYKSNHYTHIYNFMERSIHRYYDNLPILDLIDNFHCVHISDNTYLDILSELKHRSNGSELILNYILNRLNEKILINYYYISNKWS